MELRLKYITSQRGAGLIEVMVTVLILSTSLLGLAALQNRSLQYNHSAYLRSQANIFAYDLLDRVRINRKHLDDYNLDMASDPPASPGTRAQTDISEWHSAITAALPGGDSSVSCVSATGLCTVTITWSEQNSSGENSEDTSSFQYTTRI